jgi:DNA-binding MurR/RpiR family transcriptional regulator
MRCSRRENEGSTVDLMEVAERIRAHGATLTAAERRVAEAVLAAPQAVGFGTVADLAQAANVGAASVVRLATKLGFDGYSDLQQCVQRDLTRELRPAAERIHDAEEDEPIAAHVRSESANVTATVQSAAAAGMGTLVARIADLDRPVALVSGEATAGVVLQFANQLHQLRPGISTIGGSEVSVRRELALLPESATAIVVDLRRYERWVLDAHRTLRERGIWSAGLTDSMLSPVAQRADVTFIVSAASVGPFDSHVGTLALLHLVAANAATALRSSATARLASVEQAWSDGTLTDGS